MEAFGYASPAAVEDALAILAANPGAAVLAGGTDLISLMKDHVLRPPAVVNIKNIPALGGIGRTATGTRIGAIVTFDELASNAGVRADYPALHSAAMGVASPQIRNMGTVAGDLCQWPRCWYFRAGYGLLGHKDGQALVPDGENKYHAIFGGGPAYFVSASSLGPALIALGAKITVRGAQGSRSVDAAQFFVAPTSADGRTTAVAPGEIVTEIMLPAATTRNATYEIRERDVIDWPLATASVALKMAGNTVSDAKVVLGHVAPVPWVSDAAAAAIKGKTIDEASAAQAGDAAVAGAQPLSQNAYKVQLAKVAVKRALLAAAGRA